MKLGSDSDAPRLILVTAPGRDVATALARGLVERGLAACVNLVDGVTSIYSWEGKLQEESELLLLIKTRCAHLQAIEDFLRSEHPYDVPELVALSPTEVETRYYQWMLDSTEPKPNP